MVRALAGAAWRIFSRRASDPGDLTKQSRVPDGMRVYAIGDIHGRLDLLRLLEEKILMDWSPSRIEQGLIVYLGDYVDRGPNSRGVIESLLSGPPGNLQTVHLLGNHEQLLLDFLGEAEPRMWLSNGGDSTLSSYGVGEAAIAQNDSGRLREAFRELLPARHLSFLNSLKRMHFVGDFCFVHAGVRPGVALEQQNADDVIWVRDLFLDSKADFGKIIVHGHSIAPQVDWRANRIGIDTGAYYSDRLTCLVLEGAERRILQT